MSINIREASSKDFEAYFTLQNEFRELEKKLSRKERLLGLYFKSPNSKKEEKKKFLALLRKKDYLFIVADDNGKAIGYLKGYVKKFMPFKFNSGYLEDMIISKKYRKHGIATKLHDFFLRWIKKKGIKLNALHVDWVNEDAIKAYKRWGYRNQAVKMIKELK